jgi:uncharacterized protein (TIGR02677 family)
MAPMTRPSLPPSTAALFSHVTAEKAALYRAIMEVFAAAKRQFRLHLRPDEVLAEGLWPDGAAPSPEALQGALDQLAEWGNIEAQVDTSRVTSIEEFYRRRLLYRLTPGGEAAEAGLQTFLEALARRGELQSVALEDILARLLSLGRLAGDEPVETAKIHAELRDLAHVFETLAGNAEAFIAGLARTIGLQRADTEAVVAFKSRLIDYLQRFIGDLVTRSGQIAEALERLEPHTEAILHAAAEREARDATPDAALRHEAVAARLEAWSERWAGLVRWFVAERGLSQAELLRRSALGAIPLLLNAISVLNERRSGRSDRAADFRRLALWFAEARSDSDAHRLWRAAFALSPARHLALVPPAEVGASTAWRDAPPVELHPQLRERGSLPGRGAPSKIRDRSLEREQLAMRVAAEAAQTERARRRLATGGPTRLSELGTLDRHAFGLFLTLLGEALAAQTDPQRPVERLTMDGTLSVRLEPLEPGSCAVIDTEIGRFSGRDHTLTIRPVAAP